MLSKCTEFKKFETVPFKNERGCERFNAMATRMFSGPKTHAATPGS